jgi:glycosyltransferase involved in cell wall biosynthesis
MILPEVTGLLFEVGDAKGLAQCIRRVATEPVLAERIGSLGQLHAKTSFSPHRHAQMLMEAFDLAIRTRKATA